MSNVISRDYAVNQIKFAIEDSNDPEEKLQFDRFIDFLTALPDAGKEYTCKDCLRALHPYESDEACKGSDNICRKFIPNSVRVFE